MVTKMKSGSAKQSAADTNNNAQTSSGFLGGNVKDSAQQIWQAGLGAFAKAQAEGGKMFETLVKEGMAMQRKTQTVAEEKITEATSRMAAMADGISSKATGQWDKLETIFEDRVAKAAKRLGVPSASDIDALNARIDALQKTVDKLKPQAAPAAKAPRKAPAKAPVEVAGPAPQPAAAAPKPAAKRARKTQ